MIIDTPDGPKFEWEVDPETAAAAIAETAAAAAASELRVAERRAAKERERPAPSSPGLGASASALASGSAPGGAPEPALAARQAADAGGSGGSGGSPAASAVVDPGLVEVALKGDAEQVRRLLAEGRSPNLVAFEYDLFPGSLRMFCNDWTPLSAAASVGEAKTVELLLEARADPDVVCCSITSSGAYKFWTALDCARTGDAVPFERDHSRHLQPRHPAAEALLLAASARPSSALPEPMPVNTYGLLPEEGQRSNPCLDSATGLPVRPEHLYNPEDEEERKRTPGAPKLSKGSGGGGCPTSSMGLDPETMAARQTKDPRDRVFSGGSILYSR